MQTARHRPEELFALLDGAAPPPPMFARSVLLRILCLDPASSRARQLLDGGDCLDSAEIHLKRHMEEAETLAAQGLWAQAREVADRVRRRFGYDPVAQAWLSGVHVLWQGAD